MSPSVSSPKPMKTSARETSLTSVGLPLQIKWESSRSPAKWASSTNVGLLMCDQPVPSKSAAMGSASKSIRFPTQSASLAPSSSAGVSSAGVSSAGVSSAGEAGTVMSTSWSSAPVLEVSVVLHSSSEAAVGSQTGAGGGGGGGRGLGVGKQRRVLLGGLSSISSQGIDGRGVKGGLLMTSELNRRFGRPTGGARGTDSRRLGVVSRGEEQ
ncbi:hypothetical protein CC85DRAFT_209586 [Cutaneotrichosporon oleaginosum]|uniref:Uncharacterized protein n=1 Tax=Cutaneotrichosporon oleaginosum TaxID=879819 RepID=A0A0J0XD38_9TREE|nr:uncharacterized protein CC85DRAFT_209586 [Cutaneotrichosporon oleaginosum]KLT38991.1 hypothetical protein CC85DRAFT_209586 [Cutaneotrichosporon oleaginosum]TXT08298.1 hypothetical protein COLE_05222 [Cutaneotrichosporon oleaginosum]